jgi:pimeloyl-ACP methyl ester carboxylesterase
VPTASLPQGPIAYRDTGGPGPVVVLVHGLVMDASVWDAVIADLAGDHRCIAPTLPLGGHRQAMPAGTRLGLRGQADLLAAFLDHLDLREVVLVANDWGGPIVTAADHPERLAGLVLVAVEAFDNIPPGLPGRAVTMTARVPGGLALAARSLRRPALRRLPTALGWMARRPLDDGMVRAWTEGLVRDPGVRADLRSYLAADDHPVLGEACARLVSFDRPALIVWSPEDRVMPPEHGRRLARVLPDARLVEIDDSYTLVPIDQPARLAGEVRRFVGDLPAGGRASAS